jgi:hypothetical protein
METRISGAGGKAAGLTVRRAIGIRALIRRSEAPLGKVVETSCRFGW